VPRVQFLRSGVPLFKSLDVPAMDPRCCCYVPGECAPICDPSVLEHRLTLRTGTLVPLPGWCGQVPDWPIPSLAGQVTTRRDATLELPYLIGADDLAIANNVQTLPPLWYSHGIGYTPVGWGQPVATRTIRITPPETQEENYGQPGRPLCPYWAFGLGTYNGQVTSQTAPWCVWYFPGNNESFYYKYRYTNCHLYLQSTEGDPDLFGIYPYSAVLYAACQTEMRIHRADLSQEWWGTTYMVAFIRVAMWVGPQLDECVVSQGPPRVKTCPLYVHSILGHDRQPPEPTSYISWNC